VAQLVKALRYKTKGCGFDSQWPHWNFSLTYSLWLHYGPGVDSASNRNEYKEYFLAGGGNPLNVELNPICHLLALLGAHHILHVSRIRVKAVGA